MQDGLFHIAGLDTVQENDGEKSFAKDSWILCTLKKHNHYSYHFQLLLHRKLYGSVQE